MPNTTTWSRRSVAVLPETPFAIKSSTAENFFNCDNANTHGVAVPGRKALPKTQMFSSHPDVDKKQDDAETRPYRLISKLVTEFIGELIFVFLGMGQALANGGVMVAAFTHGLTIFVLVASLGHISGGHFNPSVTLAILLCGKIEKLHAIYYIIVQLIGSVFGALLCRAIMSSEQWTTIAAGATILQANHVWYQALLVEIILTWLLTQTVIMTAVDTSTNLLAPFAIGLSITASIFVGGTISGASMNPARTFGPAFASLMFRVKTPIWSTQYIYYIAGLIGPIITALFYRIALRRDERRFF